MSHIIRRIHRPEKHRCHLERHQLRASDENVILQRKFIDIEPDIWVGKHRTGNAKENRLGCSWVVGVDAPSVARKCHLVKCELCKADRLEPKEHRLEPESAPDVLGLKAASDALMPVKLD
jgi:hypothetical protein